MHECMSIFCGKYAVGSIPAKTQKIENSNLLDLTYIDPQARVLNYCYK